MNIPKQVRVFPPVQSLEHLYKHIVEYYWILKTIDWLESQFDFDGTN